MRQFIFFIVLVLFYSTFNNSKLNYADHSVFDKLLKQNVNEKGWVDYEAFQNNKLFEEYLNQIATADISTLSSKEKLAFYINAYNALTIKNVLNHYPIDSPMDVEGFFKGKKFIIAGTELTLDELEYSHILPIDKVLPHFGLVCAAKSCPKLIREAYSGKTVFAQLEENAKVFLNDKSKNRLDKDSKTLYLSEIFKWFRKSFEEEYGSLIETAIKFKNLDDNEFLIKNDVEIKFIPYDWQLNAQ